MYSAITQKYLLKCVHQAHLTFQSPIWYNSKSHFFEIVNTKQHRICALLIQLLELYACLLAFIVLCMNIKFQLDSTLSLILFFVMSVTLLLLLLDIHINMASIEVASFLNLYTTAMHNLKGKFLVLAFFADKCSYLTLKKINHTNWYKNRHWQYFGRVLDRI